MTPDTFLTDGINKTYATTKKFRANSTLIFLNGIYQGLGRDYTEDSGRQSITFKVLPDADLEGEIRYLEDEDIETSESGVSSFKEQLVSDAVNIFLNADEFAETITYLPKGGEEILIRAIVDRNQISPAGEDSGRLLQNQIRISIANSETYGVISVNKGEDIVSLPERIGGADVDFVVADVISQDEGMWTLLLQK
ncbi:MAG: hypothetical protein PHC54_05460 [Candidatus Omnitrophica bacterium]|nr:hypothetical protein [Candidatus Omnitrophota bacterium]MDD5592652.1 hypothetical protein [Candidatus Omnitrophota bacterium]